jgi:hypothetical protein
VPGLIATTLDGYVDHEQVGSFRGRAPARKTGAWLWTRWVGSRGRGPARNMSADRDARIDTMNDHDADRLELLDRIAERVPEIDLDQQSVDWTTLPDGAEALIVNGGRVRRRQRRVLRQRR